MAGRADAQDADEERAQDDLAAGDESCCRRDDDAQYRLVRQPSERSAVPDDDRRYQPGDAGDGEDETDGESALQRPDLPDVIDGRTVRQEPLIAGVDTREDREEDRLHAGDHEGGCSGQSVDIEMHVAYRKRSRDDRRADSQAKYEHCQSGIEEQPSGAVQEQESEMPPAVTPAPQMERPAAPIGEE